MAKRHVDFRGVSELVQKIVSNACLVSRFQTRQHWVTPDTGCGRHYGQKTKFPNEFDHVEQGNNVASMQVPMRMTLERKRDSTMSEKCKGKLFLHPPSADRFPDL